MGRGSKGGMSRWDRAETVVGAECFGGLKRISGSKDVGQPCCRHTDWT